MITGLKQELLQSVKYWGKGHDKSNGLGLVNASFLLEDCSKIVNCLVAELPVCMFYLIHTCNLKIHQRLYH